MADLMKALRNAHAAGDKVAAQRIAGMIKAQSAAQPMQGQQQPEALNWSDVPGEAMRNTPESAGNFVKSIVQPIIHPIDTFNGLADLTGGAMTMAARSGNSWLADRGLAYSRLPEATPTENRQMDVARGVGKFYGDRYGSMEGFKKAVATDPIGIAADAATLLTGGQMAATRLGISAVARPLGIAANLANPMTPIGKGAQLAGKAGGALTRNALGLTTGTSADTIGEAYRASRAGGAEKKAFTDNLRGHEGQDAVIGEARQAVGNIADTRRRQYQGDMKKIGLNKKPIDFKPIEKVMQDVTDSAFYKGHQVASKEAMGKLKDIGAKVDEWSNDPSLQTAEGLDMLKKSIDDLMPSFTEAGNSERIVNAVRNAVKDQIVAQVPEYADAMKGFETSKLAQVEIEKSLSLGKNNSADTTLRKLQSLTRNNVNTNYGARAKSAELLKSAGAGTLMPKLAGQALSSATPRGLMSAVTGAGLLSGGIFANPALLAALPLTSPRLVGEAANLAGTTRRLAGKVPKPSKKQILLLRNLGLLGMTAQQSQQ